MTDHRTVRATGPEDLLALVPGFLGFHPEESVVVMTVGGAAEPFHARVDLPVDPPALEELATYLAEVAGRHEVRTLAVLVYTEDASLAEALLGELGARLRKVRAEVVCAIRADGRHWWMLGGQGVRAAGTPYDVGSHPLMAQAVLEGTVVLGSRRELAGTLAPDPARVEEVRRCADATLVRLARTVESRRDRDAVRRHLAIEGRWVRRRVRRHLDDRLPLDPVDLARLLVLIDLSVEVRDVAWAEMDHANSGRHVDLWRDAVRRAPVGLRAAPAALLGFAAWLSGNGALAWCAVDCAQEAQPDYGLAALLTQALAGAVPPSAWRPLPADTLTLFAH